jgi:hypothetical protein
MRTLEYWDYDETVWSGIEWPTVVSGMRVRCYEADGTPIPDSIGIYEWEVVSDAYQQTISGVGDVWTIDIEDIGDNLPIMRRQE